MKIKINVHPVLLEIAQQIKNQGGTLYLVGGCVRDALLGIENPKDFDLEVHGIQESALFDLLKNYGKPSLVGRSFGIILMKIKGIQYDFALPRTERKVDKGHKAFDIHTDPFMGFAEAASRRDFTLNAIGLSLPDFEIEDPWNGSKDLEEKVLKHVGPAFSEDPLRALRAVQFAARFGFTIDAETQILCSQQDLSELSKERFEEEFRKMLLKSKQPSIGLKWIQSLGLDNFFPELSPHNWEVDQDSLYQAIDFLALASLEWSDEINRLQWLHACLASAMPKTLLATWLNRFTNDRKLIDAIYARHRAHVPLIPLYHNRQPLQGELRRLALEFPLHERCIFTQAWTGLDWTSQVQPDALKYECWHSKTLPWILGRDLIEMGRKPTKSFGYWLAAAFEKQLDGEFNTRDQALNWIKENYAELEE